MKILAIRGRNLASLPEFDLRFDSGPLARAGTFAIIGPTGAGKSTIFDALCLALFGWTPRYTGRGHVVGHATQDDEEGVKSGDPRGILRRGTGEGWAEAEFTSLDGRAFRGRWTARRAGKKARGRMQEASHTIAEVATNQVVASGKTAVAEWVQSSIGLTLEQFTRSVLLPQGEFAAFLKADPKKRAELLEKVTDSAIYRQIGRSAFERAKLAETNHQEVLTKQGAIEVMNEQARSEAEAKRVHAIETATLARVAVGQAQERVDLFSRRDVLFRAVELAKADLVRAEAANTAAGGRRGELDRTARAEAHRPAVEAARAAAARAVIASKAEVAAQREAVEAAERSKTAMAAQRRAEDLVKASAEVLAAARPQLDDARVRDARITDLAGQASRARGVAVGAAEEDGRAAADVARVANALEGLRADESAAAEWLTAHDHVAPLVEQWTLADKRIGDFATAKAELTRHTANQAKLVDAVAEVSAAREQAAGVALVKKGAHHDASQALVDAEADVARNQASDAMEARRALEQVRQRLEQLSGLARDAERAEKAAGKARKEEAAARESARDHRAKAEASTSRTADLAPRLDEAVRIRDQAVRTADLAVHRTTLVEGEACPLCGATEHPYAAETPVVDALLGQLNARVLALDDERKRESEEFNSHTAQASAADESATRAVAAAEEQEIARALLVASWRAAGRADEPAVATLLAELEALATQAADVQAMEARTTAARNVEDAAKRAERDARDAMKAAEDADIRCAKAVDEAADAMRRNSAAIDLETTSTASCLRDLAAAFSGWTAWEERLHADPTSFGSRCRKDVEAFRSRTAGRDAARLLIAPAEADVAGLRRRATEKGAEAVAAALVAAEHAAALATEQGHRALLFQGEGVDEVERRLLADESRSRVALNTAQTEAQSAANTAAGLVGSAENAARVARELTEEAAQLAAVRDVALAADGFHLSEAEERLARDAGALKTERASLDALAEALTRATVTLSGREGDLRAHETLNRPDGTATDAATALDAAQTSADEATRQVGALDQALRSDDDARARHAGFAEDVSRLQAISARWATMRELIGDQQGQTFSKFAQSITLDVLVGQANLQLAELAPRYRLQETVAGPVTGPA